MNDTTNQTRFRGLVIGGPLAGKRLDHTSALYLYEIAPPTAPLGADYTEDLNANVIQVERSAYHWMRFTAWSGFWVQKEICEQANWDNAATLELVLEILGHSYLGISENAPAEGEREIPIAEAERIAKKFGFHQVLIFARNVGDGRQPGGEHMTTYGVNEVHCGVAAKMARVLQNFMGWKVTV